MSHTSHLKKGFAFDLFHCKEGVACDLFTFLRLKDGIAFDLSIVSSMEWANFF